MMLAQLQRAFVAEITAGDDAAPPSSPGMAIYRNGYRARLLDALAASFERTRRWTGAEVFESAACHYILSAPPHSWSLDDYGADFPALLAELFAQDPEVGELAWLEWHLQRAFAAPDRPVLDPQTLAAAGQAAGDWGAVRFAMAAGFAHNAIATNCTPLWGELAEAGAPPSWVRSEEPGCLIVWRGGLSPCWRVTDPAEGAALSHLAAGGTLGEAGALADFGDDVDGAAHRLGAWLAGWLQDRLFAGIAL